MRLLNEIATNFDELFAYIKSNTYEDILKCTAITCWLNVRNEPVQNLNTKPLKDVKVFENGEEINYARFLATLPAGVSVGTFGVYASKLDALNELIENIDKYRQVYDMLDDDLSRKTLLNIILYRLIGDYSLLTGVRVEGQQYYRPELIPEKPNGVLLDCGAFDGKTALEYIDVYGKKFNKIYSFEPDPTQFKVCKKNTSKYENIVCVNKGVSNENGKIRFNSSQGSASNNISEDGNIEVDIVSLDEEITEPVSFIKMDIESIEIPALMGCRNHIQNDRPHMTICVYHLLGDMHTIPLLINDFVEDYTYNIRFHGFKVNSMWQPWEIVLYATPKVGNKSIVEDKLDSYRAKNIVLVGFSDETKTLIELFGLNEVKIHSICVPKLQDLGKAYLGIPIVPLKSLKLMLNNGINGENTPIIAQVGLRNIDNKSLNSLKSLGDIEVILYNEALVRFKSLDETNIATMDLNIVEEFKAKYTLDDITFSQLLEQSRETLENIEQQSIETILKYYRLIDLATKVLSEIIYVPYATNYRVKLCTLLDELWEYVIDEVDLSYIPNNLNICTPNDVITNDGTSTSLWCNVALMKGFGLIGYTLAEEINGKATHFFCSTKEEYSYLSDLPNLELLYKDPAPDNEILQSYIQFLKENYHKIDVLIVNGPYPYGIYNANRYKKLRPDGKVYCALDMNSSWMSKIKWDSQELLDFANTCDVISTVCTPIRDALNFNPKVKFPCRFLSNAFYKTENTPPIIVDANLKENVILTVARIGTEQKNNQEMMEGFALVSDKLDGWKLKLVGSIDPEFTCFVEDYFLRYPHLKDTVILTGPIYDKKDLYAEYSKAKIFALTSRFEGGTPNVYAEALFHGCKFITSTIDSADLITNNGEFGVKYNIGDVDEYANKLVQLCNMCQDNKVFEEHIPKAQEQAARYFDWGRNAKKLAFALFK